MTTKLVSTGVEFPDATIQLTAVPVTTTATSNLGLGTGAVDSITTGDYNVGVGDSALTSVTTGSQLTALGFEAGYTSNAGDGTFLGFRAGRFSTGTGNTAIGHDSMYDTTSSSNNTALGLRALRFNTTGANNTATGSNALYNNTTGNNNTANGYQALYNNTTAGTNSATGYRALFANTTGASNVANGHQALYLNTTGSNNTATGYRSLDSNTTGANNTAIGYQSLYYNTTGSYNLASSYRALQNNTTGGYNTATGYAALQANTTGLNNTGLGFAAGDNITTGSSNIIIGSGVDAPSATASNQLNIGNTIYGDMSKDHVGIGTTPESDIHSVFDGLRLGTGSGLFGVNTTSVTELSTNSKPAANDATGGRLRINADEATRYIQLNGNHQFATAAHGNTDTAITWTDAMTIENDGDILMGTTSFPANNAGSGIGWNPNGTSRITTASTALALDFGATNNTGNVIRFYQGSGGSSSHVGSISITSSSTAYNTSSDYRLKENVVPMSGSIDRLKALKPSKFNFIADATTTVDGFLAHEAQAVVPEAVTGTKDAMKDEEYEVTPAVMDGETVVTEAVMGTRSVPDYQGIDQSKLVPLLVASLQEAIARIEALENA